MIFFKIQNQWSHLEDLQLLQLYKNQHQLEVLAVLYGRYMHLVYGVCLKFFKNEDDSRDAVMEIFEELSKKLLHYQVDNFRSWLHVLTRNYCLTQLRKSQKHTHVNFEEHFVENDPNMRPISWEVKEHQLQKMEKCLQQLNEGQEKCVRLFYLEQKCYKEIEQITGLDAMKVKSYIQNGKRNLKICIEKNTSHE